MEMSDPALRENALPIPIDPRKEEKIKVVDVLRGISILVVIAAHLSAAYLFLRSQHSVHLSHLTWAISSLIDRNGSYGVSLFFVISGFLITRLIASNPQGLYRPDFRDFYARRVGRLFPLLTLILLLGIGFFWLADPAAPRMAYCFKSPGSLMGPGFFASILAFFFNWYTILVQQSPHPSDVNVALHWSVLWSLSVEEQFYLFFPLTLFLLKGEKKLFWFLMGVILFALGFRGLAYLANPLHASWALYSSFGDFDQLAVGVLLYLASQRFKRLDPGLAFRLCLYGLTIVFVVYLFTDISVSGVDGIYGPTLVALGAFLFLLGGFHLEVFERGLFRLLAYPGKLSYGMYLLHASVLYLMWPLLKGRNFGVEFLEYTVLTVIVASLSYRYYEIPLNLLIRRRLTEEKAKPMAKAPTPSTPE